MNNVDYAKRTHLKFGTYLYRTDTNRLSRAGDTFNIINTTAAGIYGTNGVDRLVGNGPLLAQSWDVEGIADAQFFNVSAVRGNLQVRITAFPKEWLFCGPYAFAWVVCYLVAGGCVCC